MIQSIGAPLLSRPVAVTAAMLAAIVYLDAATAVSVAQTANSPGLAAEFPVVDAARGRALFVTKGCVVCHSVNGVGGLAAPPLEADGPSSTVDIAGFAASPHLSPWSLSARRCPADRAGRPRGAMQRIGQAA